MSGVAADTINQIELGHRKARPSTLRKLAKALGVEVRELFEEPALSGKAEGPLSPEWALKADPDLFRLMIRDASSERLQELGVALIADFYEVRTREDLKEGPAPEDARRAKVFSLAGVISEELRRRNEDPTTRTRGVCAGCGATEKALVAPHKGVGHGYKGAMHCLSCSPRFKCGAGILRMTLA